MKPDPVELQLKKLLSRVEKDKDVLALIIFGSYARGEEYRDIDVCMVLDLEASTSTFKKQLEYSSRIPCCSLFL